MSKRKDKDKAKQEELEREVIMTRKQQRLHQRDRERHKKLYTFVGIALGLAGLLIVAGIVYQFAYVPNAAAAKVGDVSVSTQEFWKRVKLDKNSLQGQLTRYQELEQQFGGQGFFQTQINQIQSTLASPFALGTQTLDNMIEDILIAQEAAKRNITVSDEEVAQALREEVANGQGLVTEPQATATAQAGADATATAAVWTPTPTPTLDVSAALTATEAATPPPQPPAAVISETAYTEGMTRLQENLKNTAGMSLEDYEKIVRARLLRQKVSEAIGKEKVTDTEEQVHARHILLQRDKTETAPPAQAAAPISGTQVVSAAVASAPLSATQTMSAAVATTTISGSQAVSTAMAATAVSGTQAVTATKPISAQVAVTPTQPLSPTLVTRDDAMTLALAKDLRQQIQSGEDFAKLAEEFSDDPGSAAKGGDLGWFSKGVMIKEFEDAAFTLPLAQVSEPISTTFGYHLIEVTEKDPNRPKDESTLSQERGQAFQEWLQEQTANSKIERPSDLANLLPSGL